jgi:hypothetical protein
MNQDAEVSEHTAGFHVKFLFLVLLFFHRIADTSVLGDLCQLCSAPSHAQASLVKYDHLYQDNVLAKIYLIESH